MSTILIIEDNGDVRNSIGELLSLAGYDAITAEDGKEGLEKARMLRPDLVLCDVVMPGMDGYAVMQNLWSIPMLSRIPFVFISGKAEKQDFRKAMDLGADDYLTKPFTGDELLRIVDTRLRKKQETIMNESSQTYPLEQASIESLLARKNIKRLRKKDVLFMEGDTSNYLYYILSGKIKTVKTNEWGKEYITQIYGQNEFFGYTALLTNGVQQLTAMALEETAVSMIPREDFFRLVRSSSNISLHFIRLISADFLDIERRLLRMAYDSARKRVAEALLFIYRKYQGGENNPCTFSLQRENISALAGISPESVSRNLTDFKNERLIEIDNGNIRILDPDKLEKIQQ